MCVICRYHRYVDLVFSWFAQTITHLHHFISTSAGPPKWGFHQRHLFKVTRDFPAQETPAAVRRTRQLQRQSTVGCPALRHRPIWGFPSLKWMVYNGKSHEHGCFGGTPIFGNHMGWVKTSKPCSPFVHINIAGNWMFIPLKSEVKVERLDRNLSGGMDSLFFLRAHIFYMKVISTKYPLVPPFGESTFFNSGIQKLPDDL